MEIGFVGSAALPAFLVALREGFEAALVVGIVAACLQKAQQPQLYRWVRWGVVVGILASLGVGVLLGGIFQQLAQSDARYAPLVKEFLAAGLGIFAIAMLSWMLLWMTQQAKSLKAELEGALATALAESNNAAWGVFALIFIAVAREGIETVIFIAAQFQGGWVAPTVGALSGLAVAALMGFSLFRFGVKINIRRFFQVMGVFLLLIVGGLVVGALKHLDAAIALLSQLNPQFARACFANSASCLLGPQVWDFSQTLPDRQFPGILLKTLLGYRQTLFLGQAIAYLAFLSAIGSAYFRSLGFKIGAPSQKKAEI